MNKHLTIQSLQIAEKILASVSQLKASLSDAAKEAHGFSVQQIKDLERIQGAVQVSMLI